MKKYGAPWNPSTKNVGLTSQFFPQVIMHGTYKSITPTHTGVSNSFVWSNSPLFYHDKTTH